eukprot:1157414-Pelagomonas_calceolata.AAC.4
MCGGGEVVRGEEMVWNNQHTRLMHIMQGKPIGRQRIVSITRVRVPEVTESWVPALRMPHASSLCFA